MRTGGTSPAPRRPVRAVPFLTGTRNAGCPSGMGSSRRPAGPGARSSRVGTSRCGLVRMWARAPSVRADRKMWQNGALYSTAA